MAVSLLAGVSGNRDLICIHSDYL